MAGDSKRGLSATKSRSSGMKGGKASASKAPPIAKKARPAPQIPGEKAVRATQTTVAVKPLKETREAKRPLDGRAVDRRTQVFSDPATKR